MLVNGQKSNIERERHGQSFLRFGSTEVRAGRQSKLTNTEAATQV